MAVLATILVGCMAFLLGMVLVLCIVATRHTRQIDELQRVIKYMNEEHYDQTGLFLIGCSPFSRGPYTP